MSAFTIPSLPGEPFDLVFDVGGNVGGFAEQAVERWPDARVLSFEPIPQLADANEARAAGRWSVLPFACSDHFDGATLYVCENQHTASTMEEPGPTRAREFGLRDSFKPIRVPTVPLAEFVREFEGRSSGLVKVDVEGHEGHVLAGAGFLLSLARTVVVECQQDADIFIGSPSPAEVDDVLRAHGLYFAGIADALRSPHGRVLQFDGVWTRAAASE